jgi:inner membrane protein
MDESSLKSSTFLRMGIIAGLTLLLLIPAVLVRSLIKERTERRDTANIEISQSWGESQVIAGPILTLPYNWSSETSDGKIVTSTRHLHMLPRSLKIQGTLEPEIRYRGIYKVPLYMSHLVIDGQFESPDLERFRIQADEALWDDAFITFGISDPKGLRDIAGIEWNGNDYTGEPGVLNTDIVNAGITFRPPINPSESGYAFTIPLSINGSSMLKFIPIGDVTDVVLDSEWSNPSFIGSFLPLTRNIGPDGFHAEWKVLNLNRNFPQAWVGSQYKILESAFGTSLYVSVDEYLKSERSVKYALLFIALTFVAFFLSELISKTAFHPIQYTLIGFALILFYVLLLSLSEHIGFNTAYLVASAGIIAMITVYAYWISGKKQITTVICAVLITLYAYLFITLQLQDYALLFGSIGLFIVLFIIMYLTRHIDWFSINTTE